MKTCFVLFEEVISPRPNEVEQGLTDCYLAYPLIFALRLGYKIEKFNYDLWFKYNIIVFEAPDEFNPERTLLELAYCPIVKHILQIGETAVPETTVKRMMRHELTKGSENSCWRREAMLSNEQNPLG